MKMNKVYTYNSMTVERIHGELLRIIEVLYEDRTIEILIVRRNRIRVF